MTHDQASPASTGPVLAPEVVPTEPLLPPLPRRQDRMQFEAGRQACGQISEATALRVLVHYYGWTHLGEDTLRRYRAFVPAPARLRP
jgi:hypothetical protein